MISNIQYTLYMTIVMEKIAGIPYKDLFGEQLADIWERGKSKADRVYPLKIDQHPNQSDLY